MGVGRATFDKSVFRLHSIFGDRRLTTYVRDQYYEALKDIDEKYFLEAVDQWVKRGKTMPVPGDLRELAEAAIRHEKNASKAHEIRAAKRATQKADPQKVGKILKGLRENFFPKVPR